MDAIEFAGETREKSNDGYGNGCGFSGGSSDGCGFGNEYGFGLGNEYGGGLGSTAQAPYGSGSGVCSGGR